HQAGDGAAGDLRLGEPDRPRPAWRGGKGGDAPAARDTAGGGLMEVWLTPQQIAAMRLAGMPTTDRGVRGMAEKNLLVFRTRVRGKGIEILLDSLPIEAQRDYYARQAAGLLNQPAPSGE